MTSDPPPPPKRGGGCKAATPSRLITKALKHVPISTPTRLAWDGGTKISFSSALRLTPLSHFFPPPSPSLSPPRSLRQSTVHVFFFAGPPLGVVVLVVEAAVAPTGCFFGVLVAFFAGEGFLTPAPVLSLVSALPFSFAFAFAFPAMTTLLTFSGSRSSGWLVSWSCAYRGCVLNAAGSRDLVPVLILGRPPALDDDEFGARPGVLARAMAGEGVEADN